ncbi:equilibrative nucleoside transporter 1-like [Diadema antillarum]|uniref:equilibrative nucleoside transporter 1-like n=2 Tax=Diadema antillarum TaxID=105358 RepID=UPI003A8BE72E
MPQIPMKTLEAHADIEGTAWPTTTVSDRLRRSESATHLPEGEPLVADIVANGSLDHNNTSVYVVSSSQSNGKSPHHNYLAMKTDDRQPEVPKDKFLLALVIFAIHGVGTLYPWNSFITADRYFVEHKFANVSDDTEYKDKFMSYLGIGGFIPNVTFLFLALFFPPKSSRYSTFGGLLVMLALFILTTILAIVDSSAWPDAFFAVTMVSIVLFNAASAVYQSGMYALAAKLPEGYTQSYIVGQGIGGTFVAVLSILSISFAGSLRGAAIGYFSCAVLVLFICCVTYVALFKMPIVRYYLGLIHMYYDDKEAEASLDAPSNERLPLWTIFKEIKMQLFNIWMTFFVTLAVFPVVLAGTPSTRADSSPFLKTYFIPLCCFFTFNLGDFFGSLLPSWIRWKFPKFTWIFVVSRLVFFPIFLFCNYRPETRTLPVLIDNDYAYAFMVVIMSISNGYLKTIIMMDGPQMVTHPAWAGKAASMMVFFLILGIFCGIQFSLFFPWVVSL